MSETTHDLTKQTASPNAVPAWIASGVLGLAAGAGAMYLGLQFFSPARPAEATKEAAGGGDPMSRVQVVGGGGGGMGGGGMGGGGGGGGGGKRNLTALVGKLELFSRPDVKLHVEMDADQAKKVAEKLAALDKAETMTAEEAQSELDALEALLTPEQKTTLALVSLPLGRPGGGGGGGGGGGLGAAGRPGAGGPPAAAGAPPGGAGPPMGGGGGAPDENPFTQEANQKKLRDLLGRLAPDSAAAAAPAEKPAEPSAEKPAAAKGAD